MRLCTFVFFLVLPLCFFPSSGYSSPLPDIAQHFTPVAGSVIMPIGNEYLIDFDSSASLQPGDILTLIIPGDEVRHPITQEVLGNLDSPAGFLQVTRIKSGYSFAKLFFSATPPQAGNQLRRFSHVPTRFVDKQNDKTGIYDDLKKQLPKLNWLEARNREKALLFFVLEANEIMVRDTTEKLLYSFDLATEPGRK
jgi:hypothetical protein